MKVRCFSDLKGKFRKGSGEFIGFAITAVMLIILFIYLVAFLQYSFAIKDLTKTTTAAARAASVCYTRAEANSAIEQIIDSTLTNPNISNPDYEVSYISGSGAWKGGELIEVAVGARVTTLDPLFLTGFYKKSQMVTIEVVQDGTIQIPEYYEGVYVGANFQPDVYTSHIWKGQQKKIYDKWVTSGSEYESNVAMLDGKFLISCASKFGNIGDNVVFYFENGTQLNCIIADHIKATRNSTLTQWGRKYDNSLAVICVMTELNIPPGTTACMESWAGHRLVGATNLGAYKI